MYLVIISEKNYRSIKKYIQKKTETNKFKSLTLFTQYFFRLQGKLQT